MHGQSDQLAFIAGTPTLAFEWWDHLWWRGVTDSSTFSRDVDLVFYYIFWSSTAFFVILMGLMFYFAVKYRRRPGVAPEWSPSHNTALELTWSIVPTILLGIMFFWGLAAYIPMKVVPADAEVIHVTARKWAWSLVYDNGATPQETEVIANMPGPVFALPVNRPTKFIMSSQDVIHSMFLPSFRAKRDVFPNFYTTQWVQPTTITHAWDETEQKFLLTHPELNTGYYLACAEYCGDQHSQMWGRVMVLSDADYQAWKAAQADTSSVPLVELGERLHKSKGCVACHTTDGSTSTGPTWKGLWGHAVRFRDGTSATVDENYIRESILEPAKRIVEGFTNQMPTYQGQVTDRELIAIATFIKSLSDNPDDKAAAEEFSAREIEESKE